ncbi:MAG TPA: ferrous iron transporter B [Vicinamibacteria bacterium]|nr:ferrous iron transporter B [Vicinamibacteria bacterium]
MAVELRRVVLLGNPNVGKSALFGALTGLHVNVSNYPGTTVEVSRGTLPGGIEVLDSPGLNSLAGGSEDERVAAAVVRELRDTKGGVVLQVADAKNLRRALLITFQLGQLGVPTVLALNMADEAEERGIRVDASALADSVGVPVVATVATTRRGVEQVRAALPHARPPANHLPIAPDAAIDIGRWLDGHEVHPAHVARYHAALLGCADRIARRVTSAPAIPTQPALRTLGRIAVHPVWGWPILAAVLGAMFLVVGLLGAQVLVDLLEERLFGGLVSPFVVSLASLLPWRLLGDLIAGPYGLVTMGLSYGLAIVLPIVTTFFLAFALLEDSGYLPRLAVMADRGFRLLGLNGKAVLPMVLGLGCDTMATLTTRILPTRKERILATLLLALGIPCSAQLGVILAMLSAVPPLFGFVWAGAVATVMLVVGLIAARVLPGERGAFLVELPPLRRPSLENVLAKTAARVEWYLKEALPLFLVGTLALFVLDRTGALAAVIRLGEPIVVTALGLPAEASAAFLIGFLRRDFAATRLFDMSRHGALTDAQTVVAMVTITLFIPCVANVLVIAKERGARASAVIAAVVFPVAILGGMAARLVLAVLGIGG